MDANAVRMPHASDDDDDKSTSNMMVSVVSNSHETP